jgi:hypothetical protein
MPSKNWKARESKSVYGSRIVLEQAAGKNKAVQQTVPADTLRPTRATYSELYAA